MQIKEKEAEIKTHLDEKSKSEVANQELVVQLAELQKSLDTLNAQKTAQDAENLKYQQELEGDPNNANPTLKSFTDLALSSLSHNMT